MSDTRCILSVDQGTSGTKALLFDREGRLVRRETRPHRQFYPQEGWVEHDAAEIYRNTVDALRALIAAENLREDNIAALSITDQTETFVLWDKRSGEPVYNAVVWQCNRAEGICNELEALGCGAVVEEKTGIMLSPFYAAAKIKWVFDNIPGVKELAGSGNLLCGTIECWLIWNLTGRRAHLSDYCNASRTQLVNIHTLDWDDELLRIFGVPGQILPQLRSCNDVFGRVKAEGLPRIPITGVLGDSPAALYGQLGLVRGAAKATFGTGSSILLNLGDTPTRIGGGMLTTIGWVLGGEPAYVCEGSIICTGATIKWMENDLELIEDVEEAKRLTATVPDTGGVYLVPAFTGMGAPYWDYSARAAILGINRGTKKAHLARAGLESIAYQVRDVVDAMCAASGMPIESLRADGGGSRNPFLMQFTSDMLGIPVLCSGIEESSALGAAYIGGCATGFFDREALQGQRQKPLTYRPQMVTARRDKLYSGWKTAVGKVVNTNLTKE